MKMPIVILLLGIVVGCAGHREAVVVQQPIDIDVDYVQPIRPSTAANVLKALARSESVSQLRRCAKAPYLMVGPEDGQWVRVDLYAMSGDLGHRWATVKVQPATGALLRCEFDESGEEIWVTDVLGAGLPVP